MDLASVVLRSADESAASSSDSTSSSDELAFDAILDALPRLGAVFAVAFVGWIATSWLSDWLVARANKARRPNRAQVWAHLVSWAFYVALLTLTISWAVPSISARDLLTGFGFATVVVGFAFRDILENTVSGLVLLYRRPFDIGDEIHFDEYIGKVVDVTVRTTEIRQYDGQKAFIPNRDIFKGAFRVLTDLDRRRIEFMVGIAYTENLARVTDAIVDAVSKVDGVIDSPAPEAFARELGVSSINIQVRVWGPAFQNDYLRTQDAVIKAMKERLDDEMMEMPANIVALQATDSFRSALYDRQVSAAGANLASKSTAQD